MPTRPEAGVARAWLETLRFLWHASRGHRLRPWRSPYLRWRIETYSGIHAEAVDARAFRQFLWRERSSLWRYLRWVGEMRSGWGGATPRRPPAGR